MVLSPDKRMPQQRVHQHIVIDEQTYRVCNQKQRLGEMNIAWQPRPSCTDLCLLVQWSLRPTAVIKKAWSNFTNVLNGRASKSVNYLDAKAQQQDEKRHRADWV